MAWLTQRRENRHLLRSLFGPTKLLVKNKDMKVLCFVPANTVFSNDTMFIIADICFVDIVLHSENVSATFQINIVSWPLGYCRTD